MIPRPLRVDPREVLGARHRIARFPEATVRFIPSEDEGGIAVIVSKKTAKKSVERHLIKRRYSAALLRSRKSGWCIVVSVAGFGVSLRGKQLQTWCAELWPRILEDTHA